MASQARSSEAEQLEAELAAAPARRTWTRARAQKSLTIGAVCKALAQEFPDISISKIRYLEDQKLLTPRRTPGGYRLYTPGDVARLRTILRMQRDEFLPLRVIRQELAAGRSGDARRRRQRGRRPAGETAAPRAWRPSVSVREATGALYSIEDVLEETKAEAKLVKELEEYGVVKGELRGGVRYFDETEREIIARSPSSRATASAGATCACSAPPRTARRTCCSRSSRRPCARATPSGARRRSTRWRTSPRSPRTSSTCC